MTESGWATGAVVGYFALILGWLAWELRGIRNAKDRWPSFTEIIVKYVPRWGRALLIGALTFWLVEHFLIANI